VSKGGRIIMYIPSALGFGITGIPGIIPPNTILICDVTLVNFK
jgi:FKBP-type peptidyl-prolyl cis-trans isomerase